MGNSGSMHDIDIEPLSDYSHNFHCNNNNNNNNNKKLSTSSSTNNNHNSLQWTQSHPIKGGGKATALIRSSFASNNSSSRDCTSLSNNKQRKQFYHDTSQSPSLKTSHFKVLPDLHDGPQLRNTTNGAIIQSGGTISGRKQNFSSQPQSLPPPSSSLLQRSRTSIVYDLSSLRYNRTAVVQSMTPIRTLDDDHNHQIFEENNRQLDAGRNQNHHHHDNFLKQKNFEKMSFKCEQSFGTLHHHDYSQQQHKQYNKNIDNDCNYNSAHVQNKTISKAEKIKNKKRKAPDPPNKNSSNNGNCATNQNSINRKSIHEPIILAKEIHEKKNRLFKTKIESKKQFISENLNAEISDFRYDSNFVSSLDKKNKNLPKNSLCSTKSSSTDANEFDNKIYPKVNLVQQNSPFPIRREKSFDITLLTQNRNRHNNNECNRNDSDVVCENSLSNNKCSQFLGSVNDLSNTSQQQHHQQRQQKQQPQRFSKHKKSSLSSHSIDKNITTKKEIFQSNCDFKKELEIVTKHRSITLEYMGKKLRKDHKQQQEIGKENFLPQQKQEQNVTEKNTSNKNEKHSVLPFSKKQNVVETKIPKLKKTFYFGMENKTNSTGTLLNDRSDARRSRNSKSQQQKNYNNTKDDDTKLKLNSFESYQSNETLMNNKHKDVNNIDAKNSNDDLVDVHDDVDGGDDYDNDKDIQHYKIAEINSPKSTAKNEKISADNEDNDIQVHVRPTLPRRQLEVPQFSPTAAWKMLNDKQNRFFVSSNASDNIEPYIDYLPITPSGSDIKQQPYFEAPQEEQIHQDYHEPMTNIYPDYKNHDNDENDDTKKQMNISNITVNKSNNTYNCNNNDLKPTRKTTTTTAIKIEPFLIPWTPQQDLEDESSSEDDGDSNKSDANQFTNYNNLFSLSLPRGNYLSAGYNSSDRYSGSDKNHNNEIYEEKQGRNNNLLKLKKRLSEALTNIGAIQSSSSSSSATKVTSVDHNNTTTNVYNNDDNWLLSRSVPNSVSNSLSKNLIDTQLLSYDNSEQNDSNNHKLINGTGENDHLHHHHHHHHQQISFQSSSLNYLTNNSGKHIMYLPQNQNQNKQKFFGTRNINKQQSDSDI